jgi:hypothetical protein
MIERISRCARAVASPGLLLIIFPWNREVLRGKKSFGKAEKSVSKALVQQATARQAAPGKARSRSCA